PIPNTPYPYHPTTYTSPLSLHDALPISNGKPTWNNMRQPVQGRYARTANAVWLVGMSGMSDADMQPLLDAGSPLVLDPANPVTVDRKSTRLNSSHLGISYAVFCLKKKKY